MTTIENPSTRWVDGVFEINTGGGFRPMSVAGAYEAFIPAIRFTAETGTPALAVVSGVPAWALDKATDEGVAAAAMLPDSWLSFNINFFWANASTDGGDVVWEVNFESIPTGDAPGAGTTQAGAYTPGTTAEAVISTEVATGFSVTPGNLFRISVLRDADDAGDTLDNDALLLGVMLTRVLV